MEVLHSKNYPLRGKRKHLKTPGCGSALQPYFPTYKVFRQQGPSSPLLLDIAACRLAMLIGKAK
jgi:hypothetical protein